MDDRSNERQREAARYFLALSSLVLVAVNVFVLASAWRLRMGLLSLMLIYWMQCAIFGVTHLARMLMLKPTPPRRDEPDWPWAKWDATKNFVLFYGIFASGYIFAILGVKVLWNVDLGAPATYGWCALGFAISHAASLCRHVLADADSRPEPNDMGMIALVRMLPIQIMVICGLGFFGPDYHPVSLVAFGALKTAADVAMHIYEHYVRAPRPDAIQPPR